MTFLEVGNLDGLVLFLALIMIGPAILFAIVGGVLLYNKKTRAGRIFIILAVLYLIVSFGVCGILMT